MTKAKGTKWELDLIDQPNGYGFGRDYTLQVTYKGVTKRFLLGQDVKVFSRTLGMTMDYAIDYYSNKANSKNFNAVKPYIVKDLVKAYVGKEITDSVSEQDIRKIMKGEAWEFAIQ